MYMRVLHQENQISGKYHSFTAVRKRQALRHPLGGHPGKRGIATCSEQMAQEPAHRTIGGGHQIFCFGATGKQNICQIICSTSPRSLSGFSSVVSSPHALAPPLCARAAARAQPSAVGLHRQRLRHRPLRALARRRASRAEGSARHPPHPLEEGPAAVLWLRAYATGVRPRVREYGPPAACRVSRAPREGEG